MPSRFQAPRSPCQGTKIVAPGCIVSDPVLLRTPSFRTPISLDCSQSPIMSHRSDCDGAPFPSPARVMDRIPLSRGLLLLRVRAIRLIGTVSCLAFNLGLCSVTAIPLVWLAWRGIWSTNIVACLCFLSCDLSRHLSNHCCFPCVSRACHLYVHRKQVHD